MKKSKRHAETAPSRDAADRVRHLLQQHWAGNQNQMARDVGCSQSSLSRVVRGESQPGKRLLKLIADFGVAADWIFHGRGEPGLGKTQAEVAFALPITQNLLAGPATEHPDRIQGQQFPVAAALYQASRCWYELPERAAIRRTRRSALGSPEWCSTKGGASTQRRWAVANGAPGRN